MSAYLVCKNDDAALNVDVFASGPESKGEAVAAFTSSELADKYVQDSGMADSHTVATVDPIPFLRWLLQVHDEGIRHLILDPNHAEQKAGQRLSALDVRAQLEHASRHIVELARPDF